MLTFEEHFDAPVLDRAVWLASYLPAWSSADAAAATYEVRDSCLHLTIAPDQALWMPGEHTPLRVSGIQSGNFSGPVGSTIGQQTFRDGALVREKQDAFWGFTPLYGHLEMRARMVIPPGTMAAWWMVGRETVPEESAEICVVEVFGDAPEAIGAGLHPFRDQRVVDDFAAPTLDIDVAEFHTYGVDWREHRVDFSVDGQPLRSCANPPGYPMQMMLAVFDFPEQRPQGSPELVIDYLRYTDR